MVYLSESSVHGFGVFADKNYNIGDTLELCYYLVTDDSDMTNTCILHDYVFGTPNEEEEYLVPLGNAMMYNHSCLLYTSPSPRDYAASRMPSSA